MKQKITIGLLVFFLGILITACGKKNNASPNHDDDWYYDNFRDITIPEDCGRDCKRTMRDLTFEIEDKEEYAALFIGDIGSSLNGNYAGPVLDIGNPSQDIGIQIANMFLNAFIPPVVNCGSAVLAGNILRRLAGNSAAIQAECDVINGNRDLYDDLRDSYGAEVDFHFDDRVSGNGIDSVTVHINRDGDSAEFSRRQNDYLFYDRDGNSLEIESDRIYITTSSGRVGYVTN